MSNALLLKSGVRVRDEAFKLFEENIEVPIVSKILGVPRDTLYGMYNAWKKLSGHPDVHHSGKGDFVDVELAGKRDLKILDLFAYLGDGVTEGDMMQGFKKHGVVTAKSRLDGDAIKVLHSIFAEVGNADSKKFNVLAIDGYGLVYGAAFLHRGASSLIKSTGGDLFTSFNLPKMFCGKNKSLQHLAGIYFGTLTPDEGDMSDFVAKSCYAYGHIAEHKRTLRVGSGGEGLLIMHHQLKPWAALDKRLDIVTELFDLEK